MREALPVSAHILTYNSATTLDHAVESVPACDDLLVIE